MLGKYGGYQGSELLVELYDYSNSAVGGIDFYVDYSRRAGGPTLELGSGTGRILIPTAVAGCEITGLDISTHMLKKCQAKLSLQSRDVLKRVRLVQGNMTNFSIDRVFSLITIPYNTFQYLVTTEEQKACLGCVQNHLADNGVFVLDVFNPDFPRLHDTKYQQEQAVFADMKLPDDRILSMSSRIASFHRSEQINEVELLYYIRHPDGHQERIVRAIPLRYFFRYEVEHLLNLCGFEVAECFGDYDRSTYSDSSPKMIFVAKKTTTNK
jgi:SAM-dependent methyltransferase